jgi:hypothetical protein
MIMRLGLPFDALHSAIASAVMKDLSGIEYWQRDWDAYNKLSKTDKAQCGVSGGPGKKELRRPTVDEIEVVMFPQTWGSTALGYGGMGGSAMTPAYTVIVSEGGVSCVYFGCGRLAYRVGGPSQSPQGSMAFATDRASQNMVRCGEQGKYA